MEDEWIKEVERSDERVGSGMGYMRDIGLGRYWYK